MAIARNLMTLGLGAGLMYFLDPRDGRRRRALLRDQGVHVGRLERTLLGKAGRDLSNRAHGLAERVRHPTAKNVPDEVLADRVRSKLGRVVSHPGAIEVQACDGCVVLWGPVLAHEHAGLVSAVQGVTGVCDVIDRLEPHERAADIPSLQGEGRVAGRGRRGWSPALRAAAIAGGGGLLLSGLAGGGGLGGTARMLAGGALMARGVIDQPLRDGVVVRKAITVEAPVELVFTLWSNLGNFPRFMQHVRSVEVSDGGLRSHWKVDGPFGAPIGFDAEMTQLVPDQRVEWKTLPGQPIEHEGCVHFQPAGDATRVLVEMRYRPPGGVIGHALARLFGWDPRARMNDDLVRMKGLLEAGHTRAHGHKVAVADVLPPPF